MSFLRGLRLLLLGETWVLPIGVLAVLLACTVLRAWVPGPWRDAGGFVLLAGVMAVLALSVARGSRGR
jgi:hypothetical protein